MAYDFERADGSKWGITSVGWRLLRHLAEQFGWEPAGTLPPEDAPTDATWAGDYAGNSGQLVTAADAAELAVALRAALASPKFEVIVVAFGADFRGQLAAHSTPTTTLTAGPFPPDEWRRAAEEFAALCDGNAFRIY